MQADRIRESGHMDTPQVDITFEVIDRFLEKRGWRKDGEWCWRDPERQLLGAVHWANALEVQLRRDHEADAAEMTRNLGALAGAAR